MENVGFYYSSKKGVNTGMGGAYYSLLVYKKELETKYDTTVIHYNELDYTVIDKQTNILLKKSESFTERYKSLESYFKNKPVAVFSFSGMQETILLRWFCYIYNCKYIYVRAGGYNYRLKQYYINCIFFHNENMQFCKGKYCENTFLVSNRIDPPILNESRISMFKEKHNLSDKTLKILRVSRVNKSNLPTFIATINQHVELLQKGLDVVSHLIGFEEDIESGIIIREKIKGIKGIHFFSDEYYTINTKELIPYYDVVIGIGRGFWEAVACNKVVLGFSQNSFLPVLINEENLEVFKEFNFSTRVKLSSYTTFVDNHTISSSNEKSEEYRALLKQCFVKDYSSESLFTKLEEIIFRSSKENLYKIVMSYLEFYFDKTKYFSRNQLIKLKRIFKNS